MNKQQRDQERIRLWELDRKAAQKMCEFDNDMRVHSCHVEEGPTIIVRYEAST